MPRRYFTWVKSVLTTCSATCACAAFAFFYCRAVEADPLTATRIVIGEEVGGADGLHFLTGARQGGAETKDRHESFVVDIFWQNDTSLKDL